MSESSFYITTPIYYVNDQPHIGHIYTTMLADVVARYHRLAGDDVFFLTGTDEHATKVSDKAEEKGLTPQAWADENAAVFQKTFDRLGFTHDDFIRTSQDRHKSKVLEYIAKMLESGAVYEGEYVGWYDAGQEEYIPENKARELDYKSPINKKPLIKKTEKNYFFKLSAYQDRLQKYIQDNPTFIQPEARRNEVLGRIRDGLNDVPVSRTGTGGWGIPMPNDLEQTIYVWIDALFNYLSAVDTEERRDLWPAQHHLIGKDILWFHAVIWPAMLMSLEEELPGQIYAHSWWTSEGMKMSKTLGNFIDLAMIDSYIEEFGLDSLRFFMITQGPIGATDSDFSRDKFIEVYNTQLAGRLGNCASRVTNMINKYFGGMMPSPAEEDQLAKEVRKKAESLFSEVEKAYARADIAGAVEASMDLVRAVDGYIEETQPFRLAKDESKTKQLGMILYTCSEAIRIASLGLWPVMPEKIEQLWLLLDLDYKADSGDLGVWSKWGLPGSTITKGKPLFPRYVAPKD